MVPQGDGSLPVVMVQGATLTGKTRETTPDGRMGWDEYFVRKGGWVQQEGAHVAISEALEGSQVTWTEQVSEQECRR